MAASAVRVIEAAEAPAFEFAHAAGITVAKFSLLISKIITKEKQRRILCRKWRRAGTMDTWSSGT